ncbi:zinc finger, CCHC-type containing protein [Tanacetum coccineum]|uniref:Zinc finger, CCHC-type containing protein n=1 Tax=Tanacetum coccineum TaxID=301880 RepID=A0ABQ5CB28_9ASTR
MQYLMKNRSLQDLDQKSIEEDPRTYNEAMQSRDAAFWKEAIDDEIGSIKENNTWILSDLPPDKFKARLVIQGFRQKEGIDYFDTYAPVARITTIRLLLALAAIHNLVIHQMDLKTAFLNGDLDEEVLYSKVYASLTFKSQTALPVDSKIHPVFHVSLLKLFSGSDTFKVTPIPGGNTEGHPVEEPVAICGTRAVLCDGRIEQQVLVQWAGRSPEEATWEWLSEFQNAYPAYDLEDKVIFEGTGNDTPAVREPRRTSRTSVAPVWHKDFVKQ